MRDLEEYVLQCIDELKGIGIEPGRISSLEINTRARKRWGSCAPVYDGRGNITGYRISINRLLLDEKIPERALKNTIIHELLHSCKGCLTHRNRWKILAEKVGRELGYDIRRVGSRDHEGIAVEIPSKPPKYIIRCMSCGETYARKRRSKVVDHPELYRCGKCNGKLELVKK